MVDVFTPKERSQIMARIKGRDTGPELKVRRLLHAMGFRYRLHASELPGTPDIVLPRHRKIIQVHGCFWHAHRGCRRAKAPESNVGFWRNKIQSNIARDSRTERQLRRLGWSVMIVWECHTRDIVRLEKRLRSFMSK